MSSKLRSFIDMILADPYALGPRMVFYDYLQDQGEIDLSYAIATGPPVMLYFPKPDTLGLLAMEFRDRGMYTISLYRVLRTGCILTYANFSNRMRAPISTNIYSESGFICTVAPRKIPINVCANNEHAHTYRPVTLDNDMMFKQWMMILFPKEFN